MEKLRMFLFILTICACNGVNKQTSERTEEEKPSVAINIPNKQKLQLTVEGMTCSGCENAIQNKLRNINGVNHSKANHKEATVIVVLDSLKTNAQEIKNVITKLGYTAKAYEILSE